MHVVPKEALHPDGNIMAPEVIILYVLLFGEFIVSITVQKVPHHMVRNRDKDHQNGNQKPLLVSAESAHKFLGKRSHMPVLSESDYIIRMTQQSDNLQSKAEKGIAKGEYPTSPAEGTLKQHAEDNKPDESFPNTAQPVTNKSKNTSRSVDGVGSLPDEDDLVDAEYAGDIGEKQFDMAVISAANLSKFDGETGNSNETVVPMPPEDIQRDELTLQHEKQERAKTVNEFNSAKLRIAERYDPAISVIREVPTSKQQTAPDTTTPSTNMKYLHISTATPPHSARMEMDRVTYPTPKLASVKALLGAAQPTQDSPVTMTHQMFNEDTKNFLRNENEYDQDPHNVHVTLHIRKTTAHEEMPNSHKMESTPASYNDPSTSKMLDTTTNSTSDQTRPAVFFNNRYWITKPTVAAPVAAVQAAQKEEESFPVSPEERFTTIPDNDRNHNADSRDAQENTASETLADSTSDNRESDQDALGFLKKHNVLSQKEARKEFIKLAVKDYLSKLKGPQMLANPSARSDTSHVQKKDENCDGFDCDMDLDCMEKECDPESDSSFFNYAAQPAPPPQPPGVSALPQPQFAAPPAPPPSSPPVEPAQYNQQPQYAPDTSQQTSNDIPSSPGNNYPCAVPPCQSSVPCNGDSCNPCQPDPCLTPPCSPSPCIPGMGPDWQMTDVKEGTQCLCPQPATQQQAPTPCVCTRPTPVQVMAAPVQVMQAPPRPIRVKAVPVQASPPKVTMKKLGRVYMKKPVQVLVPTRNVLLAKQVQKPISYVQRAPPVIQQRPIVVQQAPSVVQQAPAVVQQAPAVVQHAPAVVQQAPAVVQQAPPPVFVQQAPPVVQQAPSVIQQAPPIVHQAPPVVQQAPAIFQQAPSVVQQAPLVAQQAPSVVQQAPSVVQQAPSVVQQVPSVIQQAPSVIQSAPVLQQSPATILQHAPALPQPAQQISQQIPSLVQHAPSFIQSSNPLVQQAPALQQLQSPLQSASQVSLSQTYPLYQQAPFAGFITDSHALEVEKAPSNISEIHKDINFHPKNVSETMNEEEKISDQLANAVIHSQKKISKARKYKGISKHHPGSKTHHPSTAKSSPLLQGIFDTLHNSRLLFQAIHGKSGKLSLGNSSFVNSFGNEERTDNAHVVRNPHVPLAQKARYKLSKSSSVEKEALHSFLKYSTQSPKKYKKTHGQHELKRKQTEKIKSYDRHHSSRKPALKDPKYKLHSGKTKNQTESANKRLHVATKPASRHHSNVTARSSEAKAKYNNTFIRSREKLPSCKLLEDTFYYHFKFPLLEHKVNRHKKHILARGIRSSTKHNLLQAKRRQLCKAFQSHQPTAPMEQLANNLTKYRTGFPKFIEAEYDDVSNASLNRRMSAPVSRAKDKLKQFYQAIKDIEYLARQRKRVSVLN